jgi:hypothetical protein
MHKYLILLKTKFFSSILVHHDISILELSSDLAISLSEGSTAGIFEFNCMTSSSSNEINYLK